MVTVKKYRANQLSLTIDAVQDSQDEWVHTKQNKNRRHLAGQENERSPNILQKQD